MEKMKKLIEAKKEKGYTKFTDSTPNKVNGSFK